MGFADDTGLFLKGDLDNLFVVEKAIATFCIASRSKVNWNKTIVFWVRQNEPPEWSPDTGFRWIPNGTRFRYLGCQLPFVLLREQKSIGIK